MASVSAIGIGSNMASSNGFCWCHGYRFNKDSRIGLTASVSVVRVVLSWL